MPDSCSGLSDWKNYGGIMPKHIARLLALIVVVALISWV